MILGDIIRVEDAHTYVARMSPDAIKENIGCFIKIRKNDVLIVGVIKNITNSIREDLIPYVNPDMQSKYAPFNEDFRTSYYIIQGLGTMKGANIRYSIVSPPDVTDNVEILEKEEVKSFHMPGGKPAIPYFRENELSKDVVIAIIDRMEMLFPECTAFLKLGKKYVQRTYDRDRK